MPESKDVGQAYVELEEQERERVYRNLHECGAALGDADQRTIDTLVNFFNDEAFQGFSQNFRKLFIAIEARENQRK